MWGGKSQETGGQALKSRTWTSIRNHRYMSIESHMSLFARSKGNGSLGETGTGFRTSCAGLALFRLPEILLSPKLSSLVDILACLWELGNWRFLWTWHFSSASSFLTIYQPPVREGLLLLSTRLKGRFGHVRRGRL